MFHWKDWRKYVYPMFGKVCPEEICRLNPDESSHSNLMPAPPKLTRGTSQSSTYSGMSAEDVQRQHDMFHDSETPLLPEEIASIISGSLSLVDNNDSSDDESCDSSIRLSLTRREAEWLSGNMKEPTVALPTNPDVIQNLSEKKKALHDRLAQRRAEYMKKKEDTKLQERLRASSVDYEGSGYQPHYSTTH